MLMNVDSSIHVKITISFVDSTLTVYKHSLNESQKPVFEAHLLLLTSSQRSVNHTPSSAASCTLSHFYGPSCACVNLCALNMRPSEKHLPQTSQTCGLVCENMCACR